MAAQLEASQEGLRSVSKYISVSSSKVSFSQSLFSAFQNVKRDEI
jgi:hypothetical protein